MLPDKIANTAPANKMQERINPVSVHLSSVKVGSGVTFTGTGAPEASKYETPNSTTMIATLIKVLLIPWPVLKKNGITTAHNAQMTNNIRDQFSNIGSIVLAPFSISALDRGPIST